MSRFSGIALVVLSLVLPAGALDAQWLKEPTKGIPRTADGKPNLTAPAPRTADGKPDLSGLWRFDAGPYGDNVLGGSEARRDSARASTRSTSSAWKISARTIPSTFRCLPPGPRALYAPQGWVRIIQTPTSHRDPLRGPDVPADLHGRPRAAEGSEPELHGLLGRPLGRRHARRRQHRVQRDLMARLRRPSAQRGAAHDRAHHAQELRTARRRGPVRRSEDRHACVHRARPRGDRDRHRDARVRLQREPEGRWSTWSARRRTKRSSP